jgi:hypothetical protein
MNHIDPLSVLAIELDRPVDPRSEFAADLLQQLLDELPPSAPTTEPSRQSTRLTWFRSRPPRLRVVLVAIVAALILTGIATATYLTVRALQAAAPDNLLFVTLHGHATANRTRPVKTHEAGSWTIRWQVRESQLTVGRHFLSISAVVTGRASARGPSVSCRGTLAAGHARYALTVTDKTSTGIGFTTSPNPFTTAVSSACQPGVAASRWPLQTGRQRVAWRLFNHPGFGFVLPGYKPGPQGGNGEGWRLAHGVTWVVTVTVACAPYLSGCPPG